MFPCLRNYLPPCLPACMPACPLAYLPACFHDCLTASLPLSIHPSLLVSLTYLLTRSLLHLSPYHHLTTFSPSFRLPSQFPPPVPLPRNPHFSHHPIAPTFLPSASSLLPHPPPAGACGRSQQVGAVDAVQHAGGEEEQRQDGRVSRWVVGPHENQMHEVQFQGWSSPGGHSRGKHGYALMRSDETVDHLLPLRGLPVGPCLCALHEHPSVITSCSCLNPGAAVG